MMYNVSVYMDDLSNLLIQSGVGFCNDNVCVNHVFYEDDLCLMVPCAIAVQNHSSFVTITVSL